MDSPPPETLMNIPVIVEVHSIQDTGWSDSLCSPCKLEVQEIEERRVTEVYEFDEPDGNMLDDLLEASKSLSQISVQDDDDLQVSQDTLFNWEKSGNLSKGSLTDNGSRELVTLEQIKAYSEHNDVIPDSEVEARKDDDDLDVDVTQETLFDWEQSGNLSVNKGSSRDNAFRELATLEQINEYSAHYDIIPDSEIEARKSLIDDSDEDSDFNLRLSSIHEEKPIPKEDNYPLTQKRGKSPKFQSDVQNCEDPWGDDLPSEREIEKIDDLVQKPATGETYGPLPQKRRKLTDKYRSDFLNYEDPWDSSYSTELEKIDDSVRQVTQQNIVDSSLNDGPTEEERAKKLAEVAEKVVTRKRKITDLIKRVNDTRYIEFQLHC